MWRLHTIALAAGLGIVAGMHAADEPGTALRRGIAHVEAKRYAAAVTVLKDLRLPKLEDYTAFYLASAHYKSGNFGAAVAALEPVWQHEPASPFLGRAVQLAAEALLQQGRPRDAIRIVQEHDEALTPPQGEMALADAYAALGEKVDAAVYYQRVYYGYPLSAAAPRAATELEKLRATLGAQYPQARPEVLLARATKLLDAGQVDAARKELAAMVSALSGQARELAQVRIGAADYKANKNAAALAYLKSLKVQSAEADAERLYYMSQAARRLERLNEMTAIAQGAAAKYPSSPWTVDALIAAGNRFLVDNQAAHYEPLYRLCYKALPGDSRTALCHWKVAWTHYLRRDRDAAGLLLEHLKLYPASSQAASALYFLGRLAEQDKDRARARAFYEEAQARFPNHFYSLLSRQRLEGLRGVRAAPEVAASLQSIAFPGRLLVGDFSAEAAAAARLERSRSLANADLIDLAERELRFGADRGEQPHVLALELARLTGRANPAQALRYIKRYVPGYLTLPVDAAPRDFWQYAFPFPYRASLEEYARQHGLDPFLLAGLIRQESEFDPKVVSRAGARGLAQITPATAREIGRKLKVFYTPARLFQPEYNLRFGAYYLKLMTTRLGGNEVAALAAYNAGLTRARQWLKWADFEDPAEFIETIPLTETRTYVQAVLRNAAAYRELYGKELRAAAE